MIALKANFIIHLSCLELFISTRMKANIFRVKFSYSSDKRSVQINDQSYFHADNLFQFCGHLWSDGCATHVIRHVDANIKKIVDLLFHLRCLIISVLCTSTSLAMPERDLCRVGSD